MNNLITNQKDEYDFLIEVAKKLILKQQLKAADEYLRQAIASEPLKPMAYNLMGVMFELEDEILNAQKMYRAAMAIEPSYTPAIKNLDRSAQWQYTKKGISMGFEF